jgi:hypothetical protein
MNAFVSPLGVACCVIISINHKGQIKSFVEPTLKINVVGSIYEPIWYANFLMESDFECLGNIEHVVAQGCNQMCATRTSNMVILTFSFCGCK